HADAGGQTEEGPRVPAAGARAPHPPPPPQRGGGTPPQWGGGENQKGGGQGEGGGEEGAARGDPCPHPPGGPAHWENPAGPPPHGYRALCVGGNSGNRGAAASAVSRCSW